MRPPKRVLLISHRENWLAETKFMLETRGFSRSFGFRIWTAMTARAALDTAVRERVHMAAIELELEEGDGLPVGNRVARELMAASVPSLLVTQKRGAGSVAHDAASFMARPTPVELLERCRVMAARKRGPKPAVPIRTVADGAAHV